MVRTVDPQQHVEIAQYVVGTTLRHTREFALFAEQQRRGEWLRRHYEKPSEKRARERAAAVRRARKLERKRMERDGAR